MLSAAAKKADIVSGPLAAQADIIGAGAKLVKSPSIWFRSRALNIFCAIYLL